MQSSAMCRSKATRTPVRPGILR
uniref:Uncharacterized protein n=1 Tax=Neospora caninum (strain Liverpool) TaxID=572307 RepID=A0A0F7UA12_NEOCL|nr:TPA: hypothetical protein BN1204_016875 [Neospora caninum Liverpool]